MTSDDGSHLRMIMALAVFSGDLNPDPDTATDELRKAGYIVNRLPDNHPLLAHPLDDFIEATIEACDDEKVIDAIGREVDGIADRYGGLCMEVGTIDRSYVPFADLFRASVR